MICRMLIQHRQPIFLPIALQTSMRQAENAAGACKSLSRVVPCAAAQNVPFTPTGVLKDWWAPPAEGQKPGDFVIMRAEMNCVCVMSACPSDDICPFNGPEGTKSCTVEILEGQ